MHQSMRRMRPHTLLHVLEKKGHGTICCHNLNSPTGKRKHRADADHDSTPDWKAAVFSCIQSFSTCLWRMCVGKQGIKSCGWDPTVQRIHQHMLTINQLGSCKALLYTHFACSLFLNICWEDTQVLFFPHTKKRKLKKNLQIKDGFWE